MNKKQLAVAWLMVVAICVTLLFYPKRYYVGYGASQIFYVEPSDVTLPIIQWGYVLPICFSVLIIGALLIYTLRDKKKLTPCPNEGATLHHLGNKNIEGKLKIDKKKFKGIIAREGLIIISLIALSVLTSTIPLQPYKCLKDISYPFDKNTESKWKITTEDDKKYTIVLNRNIDLGKLSYETIDNIVKDGGKVIREYAPIKIDKFLIIFYIFSIYPFYLFIRFAIWAIRTLKDKKRQ